MNKPIQVGLATGKTPRFIIALILLVLAGRTFNANAWTDTNLYSFVGSPTDGANPQAGLVQGLDGNFYGTTAFGGTNDVPDGGLGTVFRISPSGSYTNLYSFGSYPGDGYEPVAGLVQGSDSNFYGTTLLGGANNTGTVFRISPSGSYTNLYSFVGSPTDGANPQAGLVQGRDGNFYGTTSSGGANADGTVFRISPSGSYTNLYSFVGSPTDGANPQAGLVQGSDSNFYGTTAFGGTIDFGTVFRISPSGSYTNLYSFGSHPGDGYEPVAGLVEGSDGDFYGTTVMGGTNSYGNVFRISRSGSLANFYSFAGYPGDGAEPQAGLVQGRDGNFYGTTSSGGTFGNGIAFRISPHGNYTNLYAFAGPPNDGASPAAGLVQGSDSNFYGTTGQGGANSDGIVFRLDTNTISVCTFTLSATNVTLAVKGGSKNVIVKVKGTSCEWTAVSNDPFITITSGSSGTGNGKVDYTIPGNTNTTALSGTMTIAGRDLHRQSGCWWMHLQAEPQVRQFHSHRRGQDCKSQPQPQ